MPAVLDGAARASVRTIAERARKYRDRGLGEQNSKASLIEPLLEALGWDIRDPDEVHREFRPTSKDSPVDYALKLLRKPRLFIEAKGLGEHLGDRKWVTQVLSYAIVAGVEWCILTDGDEYRFYNATAPVDADEKLFCQFRLSDPTIEETLERLALISRANLEDNLLDVLWSAQFVDRRVRQAVQDMIGGADPVLVRLIRRRTSKLTSGEIAGSLRRLDVRIESPAAASAARPASPPPAKTESGLGRRKPVLRRAPGGKTPVGVKLQQLIGAGLLLAPLRLFRKYMGHELEALLRADGSVEFGGEEFRSCSQAAAAARKTVTGRHMSTNGWQFWQYAPPDGTKHELAFAREKFLGANRGSSAAG